MASRKKTASEAEQLRVSQIGDFKARVRGVFELPSGLVVKLKNPGGLQAFIANGTIPNSLLGIVQEALTSGKDNTAAKAQDLAKDLDSLGDMMRLLDVVASQTIIEPPCRLAPTVDDVKRWNMLHPEDQKETPEDLRDDEKYLYTDDIDELDKQFIMQWVTGGTRDLEQFRKEHAANVAAVSASEGPADTSTPDAGADER